MLISADWKEKKPSSSWVWLGKSNCVHTKLQMTWCNSTCNALLDLNGHSKALSWSGREKHIAVPFIFMISGHVWPTTQTIVSIYLWFQVMYHTWACPLDCMAYVVTDIVGYEYDEPTNLLVRFPSMRLEMTSSLSLRWATFLRKDLEMNFWPLDATESGSSTTGMVSLLFLLEWTLGAWTICCFAVWPAIAKTITTIIAVMYTGPISPLMGMNLSSQSDHDHPYWSYLYFWWQNTGVKE